MRHFPFSHLIAIELYQRMREDESMYMAAKRNVRVAVCTPILSDGRYRIDLQ